MNSNRLYCVTVLSVLVSLTGLFGSQVSVSFPSLFFQTGGVQVAEVSSQQKYTGSSERALSHALAYMFGFRLGSAVIENLNPNPQVRGRAPKSYSEAQTFGQSFGVRLPALPKYSGNLTADTVSAINYVFGQTQPSIKRAMDKYDESEIDSAHFTFAITTALAAAYYDPRDSENELAGTLTQVLRKSARKTGLPSDIWKGPIELMERRAPADQVARSLQAIALKVIAYYGVR